MNIFIRKCLITFLASSQCVILFHLLFADAQMTSRQILMKKTSISQLLVTPLVKVTVTSLLNCHVQCLAVDTCAYVTFSQSTNTCTLYSTDRHSIASVNDTRLQVYMLHSKTITYSDPSYYPCASNPCQHQGTCTNVFLPDPQYTCTCTILYCGTQCQSHKSAFYIISSATAIAANTANIVFDVPVTTTVCSPYNVTSQTVTSAPDTSVYWFQLAAGVPAGTPANTRLHGLDYDNVIYSSATDFIYDNAVVADTIQNVSASAQLTVTNSYPLFGTKGNFTGSSVLGFRLDNIMSDQVYFSVQRTTSSSIGFYTLLTFDRVLINVGNAWSSVNNAFTAPCDGTYFFSYGAASEGSAYVIAFVNAAEMNSLNINHLLNGVFLVRSSTMLQLSASDVVTFKFFMLGRVLIGTADGLVNAQGFYYSPLGGAAAAVAWAVSFNLPPNVVGPVPVVSYPLVYVNLQNVYNNATNMVTIPLAGTYFIDLTIWIVANATNGNIVMQVILNTQPALALQLLGYTTTGNAITRSRSAILNLNVGDQLYVRLVSGTISNPFQNQFSGFRLF